MGRTLLMGLGGIVAVPVLVVVAILVDCSTGGCL